MFYIHFFAVNNINVKLEFSLLSKAFRDFSNCDILEKDKHIVLWYTI